MKQALETPRRPSGQSRRTSLLATQAKSDLSRTTVGSKKCVRACVGVTGNLFFSFYASI